MAPPARRPVHSLRRLLRNALLAADFTAPQVENASDSTSQHYIFECEYAGGWNDGD